VDRLLQDRHDYPENPDHDRLTSLLPARLTSDHSGRLPGPEADSSDPEC
jgi:hypothetical protein